MIGFDKNYNVEVGTETYNGFIIDNVYHSQNDGDIQIDNEHGGGGFAAYDEDIMGWLFSK